MERSKWTDDLLDERMAVMDERFDRQFEEIRTLRSEMRSGFSEVRQELADLRAEVRSEIGDLRVQLGGEIAGIRTEMAADRTELVAFHRQVFYVLAGLAIALIGLCGALITQA